jgi:hypothetical protein
LPGDNFNTILYDDGAGAKTGVGFQPDLVWVKSRGSAYDHKLTDSVRGVTEAFSSNLTAAEVTDSTGLTAFGADGFTVGADTDYSDTTGTGMAAWNWKAGGAPTADNSAGAGATPTAGSVKIDGSNLGSALAGTMAATRLSAATGNMTVGHGLGQAPTMIIIKVRPRGYGSNVYQADICTGGAGRLILNSTAAYDSVALPFNGVPTSTVFTFNNAFGSTENDEVIAYCFHSVEGYSKVGIYEGNGNADGPFVYTGFQPAFWFVKSVDTTYNWYINDLVRNPYNVSGYELYANTTEVEGSATRLDLVSNGFKARGTQISGNASGVTYLYYAVAASPFKTSNAR